jgi:hypothetical protein
VKWRDARTAQRELAALDELWSSAQARLTGADWEASWAEWKSRREELRAKVRELAKPVTSPRDSD